MRVVPIGRYGEPDVLRTEERPIPRPGPDQVLLRVEAVSVGFAQTQMRRDIFPAPFWNPALPVVLGGDVVGVVSAAGPGVGHPAVGDRVGAFLLEGAYAEYALAPAAEVVPVPVGLDAAAATILPGAGPIAAGALRTGRLRPEETVLVHAAAGGIGHIAVQFARLAGAGMVIGSVGSESKASFVRSLGADVVVDYGQPTWDETVREATRGRGVDVILDSVGGDILRRGIRLLAPGGRLVFYGSADGGRQIPLVPVMDLVALKHVTGFSLSAWRRLCPAEYQAGLADLARFLTDDQLKTVIHARLDLTDAAEGHRIVESRSHRGRVVLLTHHHLMETK